MMTGMTITSNTANELERKIDGLREQVANLTDRLAAAPTRYSLHSELVRRQATLNALKQAAEIRSLTAASLAWLVNHIVGQLEGGIATDPFDNAEIISRRAGQCAAAEFLSALLVLELSEAAS
jgi:hypothetical protein